MSHDEYSTVGSLIYVCSLCSLRSWQVLRAYDTRLRATERRPLLYLDDSAANGTSMAFPGNPVANLVLDVADENPTGNELLEFGDPYPLSANHAPINWLWQCRGKLLVIAIPYIKGGHYATRPTDFLPIVEHLEYLHSWGYVHGDIRAYNMVFEDREYSVDKPKGCLIDFDFGGARATSVKYPANYARSLDDGSRVGRGGQPIEFFDDWFALVQVILFIHKFTNDLLSPNEVDLMRQEKYLLEMGGVNSFASQIEMQNFVVKLKQFLIDAESAKLDVKKSRKFMDSDDLLTCAEMAATGSPRIS
jgi:hypothetical protein